MSVTTSQLSVKDSNNLTKQLLAKTDGAKLAPAHSVVNANMEFINSATEETLQALVAKFSGGAGTDHSFNAPTLPHVGDDFGGTGPYADFVYLGALAANALRKSCRIDNLTGDVIVLVLDDGVAATGAAPQNASVIAIPGSLAGELGGFWKDAEFKGRVSVYARQALSGDAYITGRQY